VEEVLSVAPSALLYSYNIDVFLVDYFIKYRQNYAFQVALENTRPSSERVKERKPRILWGVGSWPWKKDVAEIDQPRKQARRNCWLGQTSHVRLLESQVKCSRSLEH
jgi:hypothetical protein